MSEDQSQPSNIDFPLDPDKTPSKRPDQLARLIEETLKREFPDALAVVEISHDSQASVVSLSKLEQLDETTAKALAHKARGVFNEFMISPWY